MRILLIYPNMPLQFSLPHSIAQLSACLKKKGHEVKLFDTTLYKGKEKTDGERRVERGQIIPFEYKELKQTDKFNDFNKYIDDFNPDKLMITFVDNTVEIGMQLLKSANRRIHTMAGGVSVILTPSRFKHKLIDETWDRTATELFFPDNPNIELMDDWTVFEDERLYRPMSGKYYKTIPILTDNGCPYTCGFCCAPRLRKKLKYRRKSLKHIKKELEFQMELHDPEFIYFSSETFFSTPMKEFREFSDLYKRYKLPFWCQTHVNTVTEERVKMLSEMNCHRVGVGIECGNEKYRSEMVGKHFKNDDAIKSFKLFKKYGINAAANNIVGFPMETKDQMMETIELNRKLYQIMPDMQINAYIYQPYYGTRLRDFCEQNGLLRDEPNSVIGDPVINSPYLTDEEIINIRDEFVNEVTK